MVGIADYHLVEQFIPVNPGQVYAIQGWIKTVNMGTKKAWVELRFFNASGGQVTYPWADYVTSTSAYTKVSPAGGTLTPPTGMGITQMQLTLKIDSGATGGTAYFDDFYVKWPLESSSAKRRTTAKFGEIQNSDPSILKSHLGRIKGEHNGALRHALGQRRRGHA